MQPYGVLARRWHRNPAVIVLVVALTVAAVIAAVMVIATASGDGKQASATLHPAGATVSDSWFTFHVAGLQTRKRIKGDAGTDTAKGKFVLVSLDANNHDDKPWTIAADDQKLRAAGKTYNVNIPVTVAVDKGPQVGLSEDVNPETTEQMVVVFDVPADATPQAIELHGAHGSRGTVVALPAT